MEFPLIIFSRARVFYCIIAPLLLVYDLIFSFANWLTVWSYNWFLCCSSVFSLKYWLENLQLEQLQMFAFTKTYLLRWRYFAPGWLSWTRSIRKSFVFELQIGGNILRCRNTVPTNRYDVTIDPQIDTRWRSLVRALQVYRKNLIAFSGNRNENVSKSAAFSKAQRTIPAST